ncbi:hypothetical protein WJX81_006064 [Elliptochloris bilobata]|uniref:mannan endo-1,4-beta-mannosidase n=1 Tax=Elliptochloris bilobata TaxID=381761 RepID=A0AAW1QJH6_9CHLO
MVALVLCTAARESAGQTELNVQLTRVTPEFSGFIRVQGGRFVDAACSVFPVVGLNAWDLMESGAGILPHGGALQSGAFLDGVQYTMQAAAAAGLTVVRAFGHGHDLENHLILQPASGVYNETAFRGLDYILHQANLNGIRVLFTLADNWKTQDSKTNFVRWAGETNLDAFWWSPTVMELYKRHIDVMTSRVNTYNGRRYKDDPALFGWDLINEPRCNCFPEILPPQSEWQTLEASCNVSCADALSGWVWEMGEYLKGADPNHLVTVGSEGFWASRAWQAFLYNPGNFGTPTQLSWAALTGQNFTAQHNSPHIDFCAAHLWPDRWLPLLGWNTAFFNAWVDGHAADCALLGKPFVLEEFGKNVTVPVTPAGIAAERDPAFQTTYAKLLASLASNGTFQGALFWKWALSPPADPTDGLEVGMRDSTFLSYIAPSARAALDTARRASVPGCQPVSPVVKPVPMVPGGATPAAVGAYLPPENATGNLPIQTNSFQTTAGNGSFKASAGTEAAGEAALSATPAAAPAASGVLQAQPVGSAGAGALVSGG